MVYEIVERGGERREREREERERERWKKYKRKM